VPSSRARYEDIADWYIEYTRDWDPEPLLLLPEPIAGRRVLDLACAHGQVSRFLARRGASVTAVDLSTNLITRARTIEATEPLGIDYLAGDAAGTTWWDGTPFDGVVCNLALMDIDDLEGALTTVASVLVPGGWFTFSLFHPCYPGGWEGSPTGLASWPPDGGYSAEGWWQTNGIGVRGHVGSNHRMLSTYLDAVLRAGFAFDEFTEPRLLVPVYFVARCRRAT
jgi:SAM-dependent methyltransferase